MSLSGPKRAYSFTQPLCAACYERREPGRTPVRVKAEYAEPERCCLCGQETQEGIYYRVDPRSVPFPKAEEA